MQKNHLRAKGKSIEDSSKNYGAKMRNAHKSIVKGYISY